MCVLLAANDRSLCHAIVQQTTPFSEGPLRFHQTVPGRILGRQDIARGGSAVGRPIKGRFLELHRRAAILRGAVGYGCSEKRTFSDSGGSSCLCLAGVSSKACLSETKSR